MPVTLLREIYGLAEFWRTRLNGVKANYPMALDEDDHRLFVATRRPPFVMILIPIPVRKWRGSRWRDRATMSITTRSANAFMQSAAKDSSAWSNRMTRTTIRCPQISPSAVGVRTGIFFGTSLYVGVWFPYLRFYSPTDAFFNQTWKPDDIVEMN